MELLVPGKQQAKVLGRQQLNSNSTAPENVVRFSTGNGNNNSIPISNQQKKLSTRNLNSTRDLLAFLQRWNLHDTLRVANIMNSHSRDGPRFPE